LHRSQAGWNRGGEQSVALVSSARWRFERFELDLQARELRSVEGPRSIEPRLLDVLGYLIRCRDRVVPAPELVRRVWKLRRLGASSVPTAISALRRVLGDDRHRPRFIRTVARRGYRFVADVEEASRSHAGLEWSLVKLDSEIVAQVQPLLSRVAGLAADRDSDPRPLVLIVGRMSAASSSRTISGGDA
jgi:DNA-binding winged helix-turn-helix (wHTH) protein